MTASWFLDIRSRFFQHSDSVRNRQSGGGGSTWTGENKTLTWQPTPQTISYMTHGGCRPRASSHATLLAMGDMADTSERTKHNVGVPIFTMDSRAILVEDLRCQNRLALSHAY